MKLEVGKQYELRNGARMVTIFEDADNVEYPFYGCIVSENANCGDATPLVALYWWDEDGYAHTGYECPADVIAAWPEVQDSEVEGQRFQAGKRYIARDGTVIQITEDTRHPVYPLYGVDIASQRTESFTYDGRVYLDEMSAWDLVEAVPSISLHDVMNAFTTSRSRGLDMAKQYDEQHS